MTQPLSRVGGALLLIAGSYCLPATLEAQQASRPGAPAPTTAAPNQTESTVLPPQAFGPGVLDEKSFALGPITTGLIDTGVAAASGCVVHAGNLFQPQTIDNNAYDAAALGLHWPN